MCSLLPHHPPAPPTRERMKDEKFSDCKLFMLWCVFEQPCWHCVVHVYSQEKFCKFYFRLFGMNVRNLSLHWVHKNPTLFFFYQQTSIAASWTTCLGVAWRGGKKGTTNVDKPKDVLSQSVSPVWALGSGSSVCGEGGKGMIELYWEPIPPFPLPLNTTTSRCPDTRTSIW